MNPTDTSSSLHHLDRGEGRLAYGLAGHGPLVVTSPGMGDLRSTWRALSPLLVASGFRVADAELRGHGDSDAGFGSYGDPETASDLIALIEHLGGPAILVGNSLSAGAAAIVAAERPDLVAGLVLVGPFVRNPPMNPLLLGAFRLMMARPWARPVWRAYLPSLYAGRKPADFEAHRADIVAALRRPGHAAAFSKTTHVNHAPAEAALPSVVAPVLVVMGEMDPDFASKGAATEAGWIAEQFAGRDAARGGAAEVLMVPEAGHYPHAQRPELVTPAILDFAKRVGAAAASDAGTGAGTDA